MSVGPPPQASFYKRELPSGCIPLSSAEGKQLFREALEAGSLEAFFPVAEQFHTQSEPAYCGLGSLVTALNALGADPERVWKGPWRWIDESMLDCCSPLEVVRQQGISMHEFACLGMCNGARVQTLFAEHSTASDLRRDIAAVCAQSHAVLVVSYFRAALGQTGAGHFSPIGGYHAARDMVLIMDVARFKYPPHWVALDALFAAMLPVDDATGHSRGWHMLTRKDAAPQQGVLRFRLHLADPRWRTLLQRIRDAPRDALLNTLVDISRTDGDVFPVLLDDSDADAKGDHAQRARILDAIRALPVYAAVASALEPADPAVCLTVALLHEALTDGGSERHAQPLRSELSAIANIFRSVESFGCITKCSKARNAVSP